MCTVRRVSVATYFVLIGYRHRSETRSCISEALSIETNQTGLETNISVSVFVSGVWSQSRTPDHTLGVRTARSQGLNLVDCYNAKRWLRSGQQKQRKKSLLPSKIDITSAIDANENEHTNRRYTVVVFLFWWWNLWWYAVCYYQTNINASFILVKNRHKTSATAFVYLYT